MNKIFSLVLSVFLMSSVQVQGQDFESATNAVKNMGIGWNLGNTLDANNGSKQGLESETYWGQPNTKPELMKMMKDAGFGAIRVPVTWYNHMDSNNKVDEAWMRRVREVVDYVIDQGLYCILNVHHDTGSGDTHWLHASMSVYNSQKDRYESLWRQIAEEFKDYGEKLLFESYNEMLDKYNSWCFATFNTSSRYIASDAADAYDAINNFALSFVNVVRATGGNNAKRNLIVNTYGACNGYGTWNNHLKDPLKEMKYPEDTATGHIAFQVHAYPSIVNTNSNGQITGNRSMNEIKNEIDDMVNALKSHLVAKGGPVIIGEWGTSNVDNAETDYDARRELMFQFCTYFVQKCKENDMATFYWMGLSDGMARSFPAFSQPDLAKTILQAYHGSSYNPSLPDASNYGISCTVNYTQQWGELYLYNGSSFTSADYKNIILELENVPDADLLQWKVYSSKYPNGYTSNITSAVSTLTFAASMGTISKITLQCKQSSGTVRVNSVKLTRRSDGKEITSNPSVAWNCTISDINVYSTGINSVIMNPTKNGYIYDLNGRRLMQRPQKGIYIQNGKKYIAK
ncbi:MAG: glycoside hydrolase family 5 protein [Prevotella sp.]|nr:glycoside hydrolase family 5 protein [Prevotella sp.]